MSEAKTQKDLIRERAEQDLEAFINLVHPQRLLGGVHRELIQWWTRPEAKSHQLVLLPRDHGKSALVAYRVAWAITRNPAIRILYISSTQNLATKQLKFIKDILTSRKYRQYWPDMVNEEEGKREKWTETEISVDHPERKKEAIRDSTVFTAGLTTGITGLHCDVAVLDDVVVKENAYTETTREKVQQQYSLLSSIEGADAEEWVVGTRYYIEDLYNSMLEMTVENYNEEGDLLSSEPLYEIFERKVETNGDGTGEFLWPRQKRYDGKWFGFNQNILAKKKAQYLDRLQFRAQYYNDPNDPESAPLGREHFQYYDNSHLNYFKNRWYYKGNMINTFAAIDFAHSLDKKADYTAIVVIGVDHQNNYYVLAIDRFKTLRIREIFDRILRLHNRWNFRKIRAEINVAQATIVKSLKEDYIRPYGLLLSVDEKRNTVADGKKEDRMAATLHPRYENYQIYHYKAGNIQTLEEELIMEKPPHDDVKDALSMAIDCSVAPSSNYSINKQDMMLERNGSSDVFNSRFGGIL